MLAGEAPAQDVASGPGVGLPDTLTTLSPNSVAGTVATRFTYGATASTPGIFPTSTIANYLDGTQ